MPVDQDKAFADLFSSLDAPSPAPEPKPEPAPAPVPEPAKEVAPERPVSVYTAMTQPATAPAAPAKAKKSASAKAKSAKAKKAPAAPAKAKKVVTAAPVVPAAPVEAAPAEAQPGLPQLVPFGDPAAREYLGQQATALRRDPMYKTAVALDSKGLDEKAVDFFLTNPYSERKKEALEQLREKTDYDARVYEDAAARAELLRAIKPDPVVMSKMPRNLDEEAKRRYINRAKVDALNELIEAKRYAPTFKLDRDSVSEAADLDALESMLEGLAMPKLRPYEGRLPGLNPVGVGYDRFVQMGQDFDKYMDTKIGYQPEPKPPVPGVSFIPYLGPVAEPEVTETDMSYEDFAKEQGISIDQLPKNVPAPNPQPVPMESPFPDFVNDNIFAPVYAYMDRKKAEAAAKEKQSK